MNTAGKVALPDAQADAGLPRGSGGGVAKRGRPSPAAWPIALTALYLGCAALFVTFYTLRTVWTVKDGMEVFTYGAPPYPFRFRILVPMLARGLVAMTHIPLAWAYASLATLSVFGLLLVVDRYLAQYTRRDLARVLALGILYPLAWNFCGLNLMYFPFDLPGVFLFAAAFFALTRGRWFVYYALFVVATLNRETTWLLTVIFLCVQFRHVTVRALAGHAIAQAALWVGIKAVLFHAFPGEERILFADMAWQNLETIRGMLTLSGSGLKDWAKLGLMFGSLWLALPFVWRGRPEPVRRALLAVPVFIIPITIVGTIDEARVYGELLVLITMPSLLWLAARLEEPPA
jgi:hypothetical protein